MSWPVYYSDGLGWLRIGKRVWVIKTPREKPMFSERYGYTRTIAKWRGYRLLLGKDQW
jgi:hypothetical protein